MRRHAKPWTLGEVLSGGIGGFVHWFAPGGPCYGCVARHLQRTVVVDNSPAAGLRQPGRRRAGNDHPRGHGVDPRHRLSPRAGDAGPAGGADAYAPGFTSLLLALRRAPEVFEEAFRPYRFRVPRAADCLICRPPTAPSSVEDLDVALDEALARLGHE